MLSRKEVVLTKKTNFLLLQKRPFLTGWELRIIVEFSNLNLIVFFILPFQVLLYSLTKESITLLKGIVNWKTRVYKSFIDKVDCYSRNI